MKILHVCLGCFYIDNYSYQENMLPKFHKRMGYDVEIIASTLSFDKNGDGCNIDSGIYDNEYGIQVTRLPYKKSLPSKIGKFLRVYEGFGETLAKAHADIIFVHGCQFCDISKIASYAKRHKVTIYVDNHADFSNSATNWLSKTILHKGLWRRCAHMIEPYAEKFYGVLPVRVDFLKNIYNLPPKKCELLVMGADDELVEQAKKTDAKKRIRERFGIGDDDFLIVTGGKIDRWKTQTLLLMQAVQNIKKDDLRLIVFGSITQELTSQVKSLADGRKIQYIGWIQSKDTYEYFEAANLVVFPGRHSVMWEQVTGQGIPMLVKDWEGTHHVDLGGNVRFLSQDSTEEIQKEIESLLLNPGTYSKMKSVAEKEGMCFFSYKNIAKRAIDM